VQYVGGVQQGRLSGFCALTWLLSGIKLQATFNGCSISGEATLIEPWGTQNIYIKDSIVLAENHVFSLVDIRRLFTSND
jgi:hypothetical protein